MPSLNIDVSARFAKFEQGLNKVSRDTNRLVGGMEKSFSALGKTIGLLGGAAILSGLTGAVGRVASQLDNLAKASQATGVTVENLSALRYAADFAGIGADQLDKALIKLSQNMADAAKGTGEAVDAFRELNIDPKQFSSADEALIALADRFKVLPDSLNKTALAAEIFGTRLGGKLIPLLNSGSEGFREMRTEAENLGLIMDGELAKSSEAFRDNLSRISKAIDALTIKTVGPLIQALANLGEGFRKAIAGGASFAGAIEAAISPNLVTNSAEAVERIQRSLETARDVLKDAEKYKLINPSAYESAEKRVEGLESRLQSANKELRENLDLLNKTFAPNRLNLNVDGVGGSGTDKGAPKRAKQLSDGERAIQQLQQRLRSVQDLSIAEEILANIRDRGGKVTSGQQERIEALGQELELVKLIQESEQREVQRQAQIDLEAIQLGQQQYEAFLNAEQESIEVIEQAKQKVQDQAQAIRELIDPLEVYRQKIQEINALRGAEGGLTDDEANRAIEHYDRLADKLTKVAEEVTAAQKNIDDFSRSLASGFTDAIFGADSFSDAMKKVAINIAKASVEQAVFNALSKALGGTGGTGGIFDLFSSLFGDTSGGAGTRVIEGVEVIDAPYPKAASLGAIEYDDPIASGPTINVNVSSGVSRTEVEAAVNTGLKQLGGDLLDSRNRGGVYAS